MVTQKIYTSMIGRHYAKREVRALCALIDQRIEYKLPNFALRTRLLELISNKAMKEVALKKNLERKVIRDLEAYPADLESLYVVQVTLSSGEFCTLSINYNTIQWTDKAGTTFTAPIEYGMSWTGISPERTMAGIIDHTNGPILSPVISRESVVKTDNFAVLMLLLQIPYGEARLISQKTCPDCTFGPVNPARGDRSKGEPLNAVKYICSNCQTVFYVKGGL